MAKTAHPEAVRADEHLTTIDLEFDGAWLLDSGDGKVRLRLNDVKIRQMPFEELRDVTRGLYDDEMESNIMAERIAEMMHRDLMSKMIAKRAKQIG